MAISFDGTDDRIIFSPPVTSGSFSVSAWFRSTTSGADQVAAWQGLNSDDKGNYLHINTGAADNVEAVSRRDLGAISGTTSTNWSVNTWHCASGSFTGSGTTYTDVAGYLDGGGVGTASGSRDITTPDELLIGARRSGSGTPISFMTGQLAEIAVWNVVLTAAEHAALGAGFCPLLIRPSALVFYSPLWNTSDVVDRITGAAGSFDSTAPSDGASHPLIIYPRGLILPPAITAGGGGTTITFGVGSPNTSGLSTTINAKTFIGVGVGSPDTSGPAVTINEKTQIAANVGSPDTSGPAVTINEKTFLVATVGSPDVSGPAVTIQTAGSIPFSVGSIDLSGLVTKINEYIQFGIGTISTVGKRVGGSLAAAAATAVRPLVRGVTRAVTFLVGRDVS